MAGNPYDAFSPISAPTPTPPAASTPAAGNPYDTFTQPQAPDASITSLVTNTLAPVNKMASAVAGFPSDLANAVGHVANGAYAYLDNKVRSAVGLKPLTDDERAKVTPPDIRGGSAQLSKLTNADVTPQNESEKIAQGAGTGVGFMLALPFAAEGAINAGVPQAAKLIPGIGEKVAPYVEAGLNTLRGGPGIVAPITGVAAGAVGGGTGQAAADSPLVPDVLKPTANMAGNLLGGGLVAGAESGIKALGGELLDRAGQVIKPLYEAGRQQLAGQKIVSAAPGSTPSDLALKLSPDNPQLVPGSQPTTAQLAPELGQLERGVRVQNPQPFIDRAAEQNAARVGQVNAQAPASASATAPGEFFRSQLAGIDRVGLEATKAAQGPAAGAVEQIGGQQFTNPAEYGQAFREPLAAEAKSAKNTAQGLWEALPMEAPANGKSLIKSANDIAGSIPAAAAPMKGEEKEIFDYISQMSPNSTLGEFQALRGRINDEMAQNPTTTSMRRLVKLKGALDDTLEKSVDDVHEIDQQMVAAGHMAPEETALAKMHEWLRLQAAEFKNRQNVAVASGEGIGGGGASNRGPAGAGSTAVPNANGAEGSTGGQPSGSAGTPGVSGEALSPQQLDQAGLDAYRQAIDATKKYKTTFVNKDNAVGKLLATQNRIPGAPFRISDSLVMQKILRDPANIDAALKAGANRPELAETLKDYLAYDLRQKALGEDGSLNTAKFEKWMENSKNSAALDKFPELQALFENAGAAQSTVEKVMGAHKAALDSFQNTAAKVFLKNEDPLAAVGKALTATGPGSANTMADLVNLTSADKTGAAQAGLKKAVVDYILNHFKSNTEGGDTGIGLLKSDMYQNFVKNHGGALRALFGDEGFANFKAIADDLQRANRSIQGSNLKVGSNTPQDMAAAEKARSAPSVLGKIITEAALEGGGAAAGMATAGPAGAVGGFILGKILAPLRAAGLQKVDQLVTEAMLNPDLAKTLLSKITPKNQPYIGDQLRTQLGKLATGSMLKAMDNSVGPAIAPDASAQPIKPPASTSVAPAAQGANPVADQLLNAAKTHAVTPPAPSGPGSEGGLANPQSFLHTRAAPPNQLAAAAKLGRGQDTLLAHITPHEAMLLKRLGGSGLINPHTGLLEFDPSGSSGGPNGGSAGGDGNNGNNGGNAGGNSGGYGGQPTGPHDAAGYSAGGGYGSNPGDANGGYNGQGRGASMAPGGGLVGGDLANDGTTQTGQSAFSAAQAAYKSRTLGDRILSGLEGIVGLGDVQPNLADSASYSMGTYHSGFNPGAVVGGLAGLGLGIPGLGLLTGGLYHAFGGTDVVTGGSGAPPGESAMKGLGIGGAPSGGTQMAGGTPAMSGNQQVGNGGYSGGGYGGGQGGGSYGGGGDYSSTPLSRAAAQQSASVSGYSWPQF